MRLLISSKSFKISYALSQILKNDKKPRNSKRRWKKSLGANMRSPWTKRRNKKKKRSIINHGGGLSKHPTDLPKNKKRKIVTKYPKWSKSSLKNMMLIKMEGSTKERPRSFSKTIGNHRLFLKTLTQINTRIGSQKQTPIATAKSPERSYLITSNPFTQNDVADFWLVRNFYSTQSEVLDRKF